MEQKSPPFCLVSLLPPGLRKVGQRHQARHQNLRLAGRGPKRRRSGCWPKQSSDARYPREKRASSWLVELNGEPFPKKKRATGQLGEGAAFLVARCVFSFRKLPVKLQGSCSSFASPGLRASLGFPRARGVQTEVGSQTPQGWFCFRLVPAKTAGEIGFVWGKLVQIEKSGLATLVSCLLVDGGHVNRKETKPFWRDSKS